MRVTASKLRENVYSILDQVLKTGVPVEVSRNGKLLKIVREIPRSKLQRLRRRRCVVGDPEELVQIDWLKYTQT